MVLYSCNHMATVVNAGSKLGIESFPMWFRGKLLYGNLYHKMKYLTPDSNHSGWIKGFLVN